MGGFESNGMVLFACNKDKSKLELVVPPEGSKPGERCYLEGADKKDYERLDLPQCDFEAMV